MNKEIENTELLVQLEDIRTLRVEMFDKLKLRWQLTIALMALSASVIPFIMGAEDNMRSIALITIPALFYIFTWLSASLWYQAMNMGIYIDQYTRPRINDLIGSSQGDARVGEGLILGWEEYLNTIKGSSWQATRLVCKRLPEYLPLLGVAIGSLIIFFCSSNTDSLFLGIAIVEAALTLPVIIGLIYFIYLTEEYWLEKSRNLESVDKEGKSIRGQSKCWKHSSRRGLLTGLLTICIALSINILRRHGHRQRQGVANALSKSAG